MQYHAKRWFNNAPVNAMAAIAIGVMLIFSVAGIKAFAQDKVVNDIEASTNSVTITSGQTTTVSYKIIAQKESGDPNGAPDCNPELEAVTIELDIQPTPGVDATPTSLNFNQCNVFKDVDFKGTKSGTYTISVKDEGTLYDEAPATFTLTVNPASDTAAPTVESTDPDGGATGVVIGSDVSATFSEKMKASTISASTFTVEDGADNIAGTVSLSSGGLTATFAPDSDLAYSTEYTATIAGSVTDEAGNQLGSPHSWIFTTEEAPDSIAPTTTASLNPASPDGENEWYISSPVTVTLSAEDNAGGSGVKSTTYEIDGGSTQTYSDPFTVSDDGEHTVTFRSEDHNGNVETDQEITVNIDQTKPTITGSATPAANSDGWNNADVTVAFECNDATSGIPSDGCEGGTTLTTETTTTGTTVTGTATDNAGNTATVNVGPIKIDKTKPTNIQFTGGQITDGSTYYFGFVPSPPTGCTAEDTLSGLDHCSVDSTNGGTAIGSRSYVANAVDNADNSDSKTLSYTVNKWTLTDYNNPVTMSPGAPTEIVWNTLRGGQTVPLKFEIFAGATEITSTTLNNSPVGTFKTQKVNCAMDATPTEDPVDLTTTGGTTFRYDSTSGQFVQNWQTAKAPNTCYTATFTAQDGSSLTAYFKLK
jgi:hypothetical protein